MMGHRSHVTYYCRKMRSHKDLDAWKKSMDLVDSIYKVTKSFPKIANRLGYLILINPNDLLESIKVIRKLINGLIYSLKRERE